MNGRPAVVEFLAVAALFAAGESLANSCQDLTGRFLGDARVIETAEISPPATITSLESSSRQGVAVAVSFCRVRGQVQPVPGSDIRFEVWLPAGDAWNGRYLGIGNGGNGGTFHYRDMMEGLSGGYAVSGTDTGHVGTAFESTFARGNPEQVIDFGWRAIHETAKASKAVVAAYYGEPASYAYFAGCSTGGRQGMVEATRFPDDYDGIVVAAPASNWPGLNAMGANLYRNLLADIDTNWPSPRKLALVNDAVMNSCGGSRGLLDDPGNCRFDPEVLLCPDEGDADSCLSAGEVATVKSLYAGLSDDDGKVIYPGFVPGGETLWPLWRTGPEDRKGVGSLSFPFNEGFFRDWVHQDPDWTIADFDPGTDLVLAESSLVGAAAYAHSPDLARFQRRGGKLLHVHGWHDPAIPATWSIMYYRSVADYMGGTEEIDSFYRLFLGTGVSHCGGGPGPSAVGGPGREAPIRDAAHDVVEAVRHWVENDVAPDRIIATRYIDGDAAKGVELQRPWCPFPQVARYDGEGDRDAAASYACER